MLKKITPMNEREAAQRGMIERGILRAVRNAEPWSKQLRQATGLKRIFDALVADGFKDPDLAVKDEVLETTPDVYTHKRFTWNRTYSKVAPIGGETSTLTPIESIILGIFVEEADRNISQETLAKRVESGERMQKKNKKFNPDNIKTHVSNLRRKIEPDPKNPEIIVAIRGFGEYIFRYRYFDDQEERLLA